MCCSETVESLPAAAARHHSGHAALQAGIPEELGKASAALSL
jgi:hypothetical protein